MRIAIVHSEYRGDTLSGENQMVKYITEILEAHNYEVQNIQIPTAQLENTKNYKLLTALNVTLGKGVDISGVIKGFSPNLILCHNTFPNIGSEWMENCSAPIIMFLHNYRFFCASATLNRKQSECELCPTKNPIFSLVHRCYKDSFFATIPLYLRQLTPRARKNEFSKPTTFLAMSERSRQKFIKFGIPEEKINVLNNFVPRYDTKPKIISNLTKKWIFAGRLTKEKGIEKLLNELPLGIELDIYGEGPDRTILENKFANEKIRFLGNVRSDELSKLLPSYYGAFFPSLWSEGLPVIFLEYARAHLPIITTRENSVGDFVSLYGNGVVLKKFDRISLTHAVAQVADSRDSLSRKSEKCFELEFSPEVWISRFRTACL